MFCRVCLYLYTYIKILHWFNFSSTCSLLLFSAPARVGTCYCWSLRCFSQVKRRENLHHQPYLLVKPFTLWSLARFAWVLFIDLAFNRDSILTKGNSRDVQNCRDFSHQILLTNLHWKSQDCASSILAPHTSNLKWPINSWLAGSQNLKYLSISNVCWVKFGWI